jgi:hypothetical protein
MQLIITDTTDHQHIGTIVESSEVAAGKDLYLEGDIVISILSVIEIDGSIQAVSPNYIINFKPI